MTEARTRVVEDRRWLSEGMEKPDFTMEALKHHMLFRPLAKGPLSGFIAWQGQLVLRTCNRANGK
jgi:hypothetical protein